MAFQEFEIDSQKYLLHAVNILLQVINEPPLENEEDADNVLGAQIAFDVIKEVKEAILSENWHFNRDPNYVMSPDTGGFIPIPFNILDLSSADDDLIVRNWKLYSKSEQTFTFDEPQTVEIIWNMPFNDLTHPLRHYVTVSAARVFQGRQVGDTDGYTFTKEDEQKARMIARKSNDRAKKNNMYDSGYGQNYNQSGAL